MSDQFLDAHKVCDGIYTMSGTLHPISVRDQILRAHQFMVRALKAGQLTPTLVPKKPLLPENAQLIVIGAGAGGATAAIEAARNRVPTLLVDKKSIPFSVQADCQSRYLDPTQYDWPLHHWTHKGFQWDPGLVDSPLPWVQPDRAAFLAAIWKARLESLIQNQLRDYLDYRVDMLAAPVGGSVPPAVLLKWTTGAIQRITPRLVLVFAGFGPEQCSLGNRHHHLEPLDHPTQTMRFWDNDELSEPDFGIGKSAPSILISGGGDGALQDFLRVVAKPAFPSARHILEHILNRADQSAGAQLAAAVKVIQDAQDCAERKCQWSDDRIHDHAVLEHLQVRFEGVIHGLLDLQNHSLNEALNEILRDSLPEVRLVYTCTHFGRCYALNRFLVLLLANYAQGREPAPKLMPKCRVWGLSPADPTSHKCQGQPHECYRNAHRFEIRRTASCHDDRPLSAVNPPNGAGTADIFLVRHGPNINQTNPNFQWMFRPPRGRQLLPYGFVPW
jgi:hypothetical protein